MKSKKQSIINLAVYFILTIASFLSLGWFSLNFVYNIHQIENIFDVIVSIFVIIILSATAFRGLILVLSEFRRI